MSLKVADQKSFEKEEVGENGKSGRPQNSFSKDPKSRLSGRKYKFGGFVYVFEVLS
jgi:hypothetical protein